MSFELKRLKKFSGRKGPLLLIIMDGVGIGKRDESDGVFLAKTPCLDKLMGQKLYTQLKAHGTAVGMPSDDDMGNSEVGHNALGAGRVFAQGAKRVQSAIDDKSIFKTDVWGKVTSPAKSGATLHFIGLLSDGNVHSHIDHLLVMLRTCAQEGVKKVRIHALQDGRDVYERSAVTYIEKTETVLKELNETYKTDYRIASGGGRMVTTMDRYNADWSVVKRGWDAHVLGKARAFSSAAEAVQTYYAEDPKITDQYLDSFVIAENGKPVGAIQDGDTVVFFNFRGDRAIELSQAFEMGKEFDKFDRERVPNVFYAGMMEYDGDLHIPGHFLVSPPEIDKTIGQYLCANGVTSFAISETQKYGHVTYFWNGNNSGYIDKSQELYVEIPSDRIQFDRAPKMKAFEITEKTIELLKSGKFRFGRVNFANGDMVGHTGIKDAVITAVETVDACTQKLIDTVCALGGVVVVTADHGNADELFKESKGKRAVSTAHSLNPVPFAIIDSGFKGEYEIGVLDKRGLSNVAATLLNLLGFEKPQDYDPSLIS
ncbi:MAG TPA: 2,3-bisphosphoglycerate-independent phosphoglycerate mutase, partial [Candidatus Omnitrophota bacterium]|nr:2,3-bisphosphoglycerate-independent phosphoglycerate mutase [Candidatus Omnitrophota bacterium]